jgi:phosphoglycerol transferase MdoB-like AlkP superfamily enzyme
MSLLPPPNDRIRRWRRRWRTRSIHPELNAAADACRLLGLLFSCLGACALLLPQFGFGLRRGPLWLQQAVAIVATLVLMGPGVWYFVAARLTRRADLRAIRMSLVVISIQAALILIGLAFAFIGRVGGALVVPSFVGLFFLPALGAAGLLLLRARRTATSMEQNIGFDLLAAKPVAPAEPTVPDAAAQNPSFRGK